MEHKIIDGAQTDLAILVAEKQLKVVGSNDGTIGGVKLEMYLKLEAVVDAIELAIPGDQKQIAQMLKNALGLI